jgi:hypothetical protein
MKAHIPNHDLKSQHRAPVLAIMLIVVISLLGAGCAFISETDTTAGAAHVSTPTPTIRLPGQAELIETANALSTRIASGNPQETAAAYNTAQALQQAQPSQADSPSSAVETAATPGLMKPGTIHEDIPIPGHGTENLHRSPNLITFTSVEDYSYLTVFFSNRMRAEQWAEVKAGTFITDNSAQLKFEKPDRKVDITLQKNPMIQKVTVVIAIHNR